MFVGYSDVSKADLSTKLRDALEQCIRNHGCKPVEIQVNADDQVGLSSIDGIPITTVGKLVTNHNMFWFRLPTE